MTSDRQLIFGISTATVLVLSAFYGLHEWSNTKSRNQKKEKAVEYPVEIKNELTSRVQTFLGEEGFNKLKKSFIVVRVVLFIDNFHIFIEFWIGCGIGWSG